MDASETSTLPSARVWHSQTLEPGTPVTSGLPNNEAQIQPPRTRTEIAVHRLPTEIWVAVCEALRQLDLTDVTDVTNQKRPWEKGYPELLRKTANKNRPDPVITAVSILPLSHTCRYLHKVASPSLLETIRLRPLSYEHEKSFYPSVMQQVRSLQINSNQRLQHVKAFAVAFPLFFEPADTDRRTDLRKQICHLLMRFPNLRRLTISGIAFNAPLMHSIIALPLEHLWAWDVEPDDEMVDHTFILTTTPKFELRSLVLWENPWSVRPPIPIDWISQLIGATLQDLSIDPSDSLVESLPVLPDLEFLDVANPYRAYRIRPSTLFGILSKMPNVKEVTLHGSAPQIDPVNPIPELSHLERVTCHVSWLGFLIPGRPVTTVAVDCIIPTRVRELVEILHKGSVPLRDLTLTYDAGCGHPTWSPDDLKLVARYLPELETLRLMIRFRKVDGLQKALSYISQLEKLRIISFNFRKEDSGLGDSGIPEDVWQESHLRECLGLTRSTVLERVGLGEECEWILEDTGVWTFWEGGKMVRSVSL